MTPGTPTPDNRARDHALREGRAVAGAFLAIVTGMTGGYAAGIDTASAAPWIAVPAVIGLTSLFSRIAGRGAAIGIKDPETAESVSNVVRATILASSLLVAFFRLP